MKIVQIPPELLRKPPAARPKFNTELMGDGRFIDPKKEAALVLPEQALEAAQIRLEALVEAQAAQQARKKAGAFSSFYSFLLSWIAWLRKGLRGLLKGRNTHRLTRKGTEALEQLRYLSLLCDATSHREPEEFLFAESVFGEAYHDILALSAQLEGTSAKEDERHVRRYSVSMRKVLQAGD